LRFFVGFFGAGLFQKFVLRAELQQEIFCGEQESDGESALEKNEHLHRWRSGDRGFPL
jgi:hypothetical protein